jgi:hypothetical protein
LKTLIETQVAWHNREQTTWLLLLLRKSGLASDFALRLTISGMQNQAQLSVLGSSFSLLLLAVCPSPLWKVTFMFCILFASVNMQMNITECWSSSMNRKGGHMEGFISLLMELCQGFLVGPQHECHHLYKWRLTSHWREKENATFLSTECLWTNHCRKIHVLCECI